MITHTDSATPALETHAMHQAPLRIGVADGIAKPRLSECLAGWQAIAPAVPLELSEMRARALAAALFQEDVDVVFSFGVPGCAHRAGCGVELSAHRTAADRA